MAARATKVNKGTDRTKQAALNEHKSRLRIPVTGEQLRLVAQVLVYVLMGLLGLVGVDLVSAPDSAVMMQPRQPESKEAAGALPLVAPTRLTSGDWRG